MSKELAAAVEKLTDRVDELEDQLENEREERAHLEERVDELEDENEALKKRFDRRTSTSWERIAYAEKALGEVQSLELEKGHHLRSENVDPDDLDVANGEVEFVDGDDGDEYARLPGSADPLERSCESVLATGDLLPIQQLARMEDDTLASATSKRSDFAAAKIWQKRGEHGASSPWSRGGPGIRDYLDASDVRVFIKSSLERDDESLSHDYAKKLAGEAMERIRELSKHRVRIQKRNRRKDGLAYKERRLIVDDDAEIPGETSSTDDEAPGTNGVTG